MVVSGVAMTTVARGRAAAAFRDGACCVSAEGTLQLLRSRTSPAHPRGIWAGLVSLLTKQVFKAQR